MCSVFMSVWPAAFPFDPGGNIYVINKLFWPVQFLILCGCNVVLCLQNGVYSGELKRNIFVVVCMLVVQVRKATEGLGCYRICFEYIVRNLFLKRFCGFYCWSWGSNLGRHVCYNYMFKCRNPMWLMYD